VLASLVRYEPVAVVKQFFSRYFWKWRYILDPRLLVLLAVGALSARHALRSVPLGKVIALGGASVLLSFLPALSSGVMPLRFAESFFILLALGYFVAGWALGGMVNWLAKALAPASVVQRA
jgi:hypothetical protein